MLKFLDKTGLDTLWAKIKARITSAIQALDVSSVGGDGKYISAISETDGKISATATTMDTTPTANSTKAVTSGGIKTALNGKAESSHTHGNIANGGTLQTNDITIANGDKLVVTDASDSNKVARASLTFDGATTDQMLSKKGEWNDTIAKARAVVDYGSLSKAIEIGWGGASVKSARYFAVYTDSANGYNKAIKDCSLENVRKLINGTSVGSAAVPVFINADGETQVCTDDFVHDGDVTSTFSSTGAAPVNGKAVAAAINALDVTDISGFGAGKTLATLKEENGKISATFQNISITKSQVSDFSHAHGNIQNGGTLQTNDITIANGDKLVVTDSSDSSKVARASISFDGSTTTKALTPKGTFEAFAKSGDITTAIQALDVSSVGGDGKYISAISETDGKISATATTMDTTPTANSKKAVTSGGIKAALDGKSSTSHAHDDRYIRASSGNKSLSFGGTTTLGTVNGVNVNLVMPKANADTYDVYVDSTSFADALTAFNSNKKLILNVGKAGSGAYSTVYYLPLYRLQFNGNDITQFVWMLDSDAYGDASGSNTYGAIYIYKLSESGWSSSSDNVEYAKAAGTANGGVADYLKFQNYSEINFKNNSTTKYKDQVWFNYRNGDTSEGDAANKIKDYYFGDRNKGTNTTLHADRLAGSADKWNGWSIVVGTTGTDPNTLYFV